MDEVNEYEFMVSHDELFAQWIRGDIDGAWEAFQRVNGRPELAVIWLWILGGVISGMYLGVAGSLAPHAPTLGMTVTGGVGGALGFLVGRTHAASSRKGREKSLRRRLGKYVRAGLLGPHRVRFDEHGLTGEVDGRAGTTDWKRIDRVYAGSKHVYIETCEGAVVAIPRTTVGDEAEVERVVNTLRALADKYGEPEFALKNYVRRFECICPECGYSLSETGLLTCPECGHIAEEQELIQQRGRPVEPSS